MLERGRLHMARTRFLCLRHGNRRAARWRQWGEVSEWNCCVCSPHFLFPHSDQEAGPGRRSVGSWAFCWGSRPSRDEPCEAPPAQAPKLGQLFGVPLTQLCRDGGLPGTLLDLLSFVNQKGPPVEGIFRISPNTKSCGALKRKLDSGDRVDWDSESVCVVASVLKDFLRNIQGSVFSSSLYEEWLRVTDQEDEEERVAAIQSLLGQLPKENVVLLRHLFGVLHNVEKHSSSNLMTAYNLAVCVAPNVLWPADPCGSESLEALAKK
nr:rho GTPase-activating protein 20-like isoform X2 [Microcebus murinus]